MSIKKELEGMAKAFNEGHQVCPACKKAFLNKDNVMNSLSRFRDVPICSTCGTREALEGDFWGKPIK